MTVYRSEWKLPTSFAQHEFAQTLKYKRLQIGDLLSASNAEVWNHWATILKGMKWMLTSDAPLLVNPKPSWHKLSWFIEFISNIPHMSATPWRRLALPLTRVNICLHERRQKARTVQSTPPAQSTAQPDSSHREIRACAFFW